MNETEIEIERENNEIGELSFNHDKFALVKKGIKDFSERKPEDVSLKSVRANGKFLGIEIPLKDHHVTGEEFNDRIKILNDAFIALNKERREYIKEFEEVYNALDILDKEYITAILLNFETVKKVNKKLINEQKNINAAQQDINNTATTLEELAKKVRNKVDNQHKSITDLSSKLDTIDEKYDEYCNRIQKIISALEKLKNKLEALNHLCDIDKLWDTSELLVNKTSELTNNLNDVKCDVKQEFVSVNRKLEDKIKETEDSITTNCNYLLVKHNDLKNKLESLHKSCSVFEKNIEVELNKETQDRIIQAETITQNVEDYKVDLKKRIETVNDSAQKCFENIKIDQERLTNNIDSLANYVKQINDATVNYIKTSKLEINNCNKQVEMLKRQLRTACLMFGASTFIIICLLVTLFMSR